MATILTGLTVSVAANLFVFQARPGSQIETAAIGVDVMDQSLSQAAGMNPVAATAPGSPAGVSREEIIRGIQRELQAKGYGTGQPDGLIGVVTRAAIMAYEYDYGLPMTGEPSPELLSQIVLGTASPVEPIRGPADIKTREAEAVVKSVEQSLSSLGYATGKIDGKLTDETVRAIREFETDQKLPDSGRVSGPMVVRLIRVAAQKRPAVRR